MSFQCVIESALLKVNAVQSALTAMGVDIFSQESHFAERCARGLHRRQFRRSQKRGRKVGKTKRGKGTKIMAVADRNGLPVSVCIESATPHEVTLATSTLLQMVVPDAPQNLIGDNAYDSDRLDAELSLNGIQLIAPHRNRKNPTQEDVGSSGISDGGKSRDCLPGCRTSVVWSSDMNVAPRTFLQCSTWRRL